MYTIKIRLRRLQNELTGGKKRIIAKSCVVYGYDVFCLPIQDLCVTCTA